MLLEYQDDDLPRLCVQHMNHTMQITQERSEYDLMTNSVKLMQQTSSTLSEGDSSVCN